ncbi:MAG: transcriptional repressor, partial [Elusimicrobiota bacterium]|nr:transcriptional repressor [Elusimicrobiota bacterium]
MITNNIQDNQKIIRRNTAQRALVLDAVCNGNHLSAKEIFDIVSQKAHISFGTVYRNLQILEQENEIIAIDEDIDM